MPGMSAPVTVSTTAAESIPGVLSTSWKKPARYTRVPSDDGDTLIGVRSTGTFHLLSGVPSVSDTRPTPCGMTVLSVGPPVMRLKPPTT